LAAIAHEGGALFHTDAAQTLGKVAARLQALGVDAAFSDRPQAI
jgi:cysteine sulfinate desulfinase/cysteine desulfurase-like protein